MKKNILKATLVAAFTLVAGYNAYTSHKSDIVSDLALANVEALASGEGSGDCHDVCYSYNGWQCTRIYGGVTSVCVNHRKR